MKEVNFMDQTFLRKLQLFQLNILEELDKICRKHNIKYYLGFGSCLGAVRHQGFIPWDDDIDVMMLADDYLRFIEICKTELNDKFYLQTHFYDAKTYVFWNRIGVKNSTSINLNMRDVHQPWGICIDIFPIFPVSENKEEQKKRYSWLRKMELLSLKYYHKHGIKEAKGKEKLKKMAHLLLPDSLNCFLFRHYFKKASSTNSTTGKHVTSYVDLDFYSYLDANWLAEPVYLDFENHKFPCPKNYDAYLRKYYNDYMEIPKEKMNHSDDPCILVKFDEPYQKYWK